LGFNKLGNGTLWLFGANPALSGTITIAAGRIFSANANAIGSAAFTIAAGSYLDFWSSGTFSNDFTLNGIGQVQDGQRKSAIYVDNGGANVGIINGTVALNATADVGCSAGNESLTLNGAVTGPGGLIKNGNGGSLLLANASKTYSGPTLVSNGVLVVDTELTSTRLTNYAGTILSGNGQIDSSATLVGGATLSPGRTNDLGVLTVSNLVCQPGATLAFDLSPTSSNEGALNDELLLGNLTLSGTVTGLVSFIPNAVPVTGRYILARYTGTASGLSNLVLSPDFAAQSFNPSLDFSVTGQIALLIAAGSSAQPSSPKRSGICYSTLYGKTGPNVRIQSFGTNAAQFFLRDINGDQHDDAVAYYTNATQLGQWSVALGNGQSFTNPRVLVAFPTATPILKPLMADLNGDGRADALYLRADNADWWAAYSTGTAFGGVPDRSFAGLNLAYPKEGYPAPQAKLLGSLNPGIGCACAINLGDWFAIEHPTKYSTQAAGVMDTWTSWGNNYIPQLPGAVGTYDSGDPAFNDLQIAMVHDAGFDYLMFDDTNGNNTWVDNRIANFVTRLRRWNQTRALGQHPLYFCVAKGGSRGKSNWQQTIEQESQFAWTNWYAPNPDVHYTLAGKPLLIHFVWDPSYSSNFLAWTGDKTYSSRFTIRWMYNYIANAPAWANA
jgi:autotransporter-associated beta strand protein